MTKNKIRGWVIRVVKRIFIEFSIPATAATIWYFTTDNPSFHGWGIFFVSVSWFTAQIFRIVKQQRVEGEFDLVKSKLGDMVSKIEDQTKKVIGYSTGSDSNAFLYPLADHQGQIRLFIVNESEFSCYMVSIGMYEYTDDERSIKLQDSHHDVLHPILWYGFGYTIPPFEGQKRYKIHLQTRTGCSYVQYILAEKVDGRYSIAFTKWANGKVEYIAPDNFPGFNGQNPDLLFTEMKKKPING